MALIKCPECGTDVSDRSEMCVKCGFPIAKAVLRKCPECGAEVPDRSIKCLKCGFPMTNAVPHSGKEIVSVKNAENRSVGATVSVAEEAVSPTVSAKEEILGMTASEREEMFGKLSDKWAWALVCVCLCVSIIMTIFGNKPWVPILSFVLNTFFWWLDYNELGEKGYDGAWRWWGLFIPIYMFVRAAKTTKKYAYAIVWCAVFFVSIVVGGCMKMASEFTSVPATTAPFTDYVPASNPTPVANVKKPADFVPAGYKILQDVKGDLNKDGLEDCVLIIAGKQNESRLGIIITFNKGEHYDVALENHNVFSYDKEEVNYVPYLDVAIKKGVLVIRTEEHFGGGADARGRSYKFRFQNSDFELIGYDEAGKYGMAMTDISINILTDRMQTKEYRTDDDNVPNERWYDVVIRKPIKLRRITDIYAFDITDYVTKA